MENQDFQVARQLAMVAQLVQALRAHGGVKIWGKGNILGPHVQGEDLLPLRQRPWFAVLMTFIVKTSGGGQAGTIAPRVQWLIDGLAEPQATYHLWVTAQSRYADWRAGNMLVQPLDEIAWGDDAYDLQFAFSNAFENATVDMNVILWDVRRLFDWDFQTTPFERQQAIGVYDQLMARALIPGPG
jgi:hypothetical protein